jgi:hypothetical protein
MAPRRGASELDVTPTIECFLAGEKNVEDTLRELETFVVLESGKKFTCNEELLCALAPLLSHATGETAQQIAAMLSREQRRLVFYANPCRQTLDAINKIDEPMAIAILTSHWTSGLRDQYTHGDRRKCLAKIVYALLGCERLTPLLLRRFPVDSEEHSLLTLQRQYQTKTINPQLYMQWMHDLPLSFWKVVEHSDASSHALGELIERCKRSQLTKDLHVSGPSRRSQRQCMHAA